MGRFRVTLYSWVPRSRLGSKTRVERGLLYRNASVIWIWGAPPAKVMNYDVHALWLFAANFPIYLGKLIVLTV